MEPEINEVESLIAPLKKVTPLSKYLAMVLFVLLPFIGGWMGYMYAPEKLVEVEKVVEIQKPEKTSSTTLSANSDLAHLPVCQGVTGLSNFVTDTSTWVTTEWPRDIFFETIQPPTISINNGVEKDSYVIRDSKTGLEAYIRISMPHEAPFSVGGEYVPITTYEPLSNTFWQGSRVQRPQQCAPAIANYLSDKDYVFGIHSGEFSSFSVAYTVILNPTLEEYEAYDGNRPVAVRISYGGNTEDATNSSEDYAEFGSMIETIIKNMKIKPPFRG